MSYHPNPLPTDLAEARRVAEELAGRDWVKATFAARHLMHDMADEIERLRAERDALIEAHLSTRCGVWYFDDGPPVPAKWTFASREAAVRAVREAHGLGPAEDDAITGGTDA